MARINSVLPYGGAEGKIERLGLQPLVDEVERLVTSCRVLVSEKKGLGGRSLNGAAAIRELIDGAFRRTNTWDRQRSPGIDWVKCKVLEDTCVCTGVKIHISAWCESLYKDVLNLSNRINGGDIDLGIIIVPSNRLHSFLPDRTPSKSYAEKVIKEQDADRLPILLIEMEHDGPGPALPKKITNTSRRGKPAGDA
jgi:hypothetical protein